jgi:multimeric flavodoxin WrbA
MKITVLNGSPRKGNTLRLVKEIEKIFLKYSDTSFSYIHLSLANLKNCLGCFQCVRNGPDTCPLHDDRQAILNEMLSSDGIILASPSYNYNVTSLMKNFIDRFAYLGHRPIFFNQHLLIVSSTAGIGLNQVKKYLTNYVGNIWGFRSVSFLGCTFNPIEDASHIIKFNKRKIEKAFIHFNKQLQKSKWIPSFHHIDQFCTMRTIWTLHKMAKAFPYDNTYYSSLKDKKFYYEIQLSSIKYYISLWKSKLLKIILQFAL